MEEKTGLPEGARRATGDSPVLMGGATVNGSDSEVSDVARRRRFTATYKQKILAEVDRCKARGDLGALLRREGLYSSTVSAWRRARESGELAGLSPRKRGRKAKLHDERDVELAAQKKENRRLRQKLEQAELIIEVQKKVSQILGIPLKSPEFDESE